MLAPMHNFHTQFAMLYGVNAAILLSNICYWIEKNIKNNKHFYNGRYWTYNSVQAFFECFPYLTKGQINTALKNLRKVGALLIGNYNKKKYDRTTWYSPSDAILAIYSDRQEVEKEKSPLYKNQKGNHENDNPIIEKEQTQMLEKLNPLPKNEKPIPDLNNKNINAAAASEKFIKDKEINYEYNEIRNELNNLNPKLSVYKNEFFEKLAGFFSQNNLDKSYLKFIYDECSMKNPNDIRAYYKKLLFEEDLLEIYIMRKEMYAKENPMLKCSACENIHETYETYCPKCGLEKRYYNNDIEIKKKKRYLRLSLENQEKYNEEYSLIIKNCFDKRISKEKKGEFLNSLYKKYELL